jgi:prepilin-type N-terminal cleavage/methylation domain-containing protein
MIRNAFSLIEVVLSLALMSTLVTAAVSWTNSAIRIQHDRELAMEGSRVFELLNQATRVDILQIDASVSIGRPRIEVDDHRFQILTRDRGQRRVVYDFDPQSKSVTRTVIPGGKQLIAHAQALVFRIDHEPGSDIAVLRAAVTVGGEQYHFINYLQASWIR